MALMSLYYLLIIIYRLLYFRRHPVDRHLDCRLALLLARQAVKDKDDLDTMAEDKHGVRQRIKLNFKPAAKKEVNPFRNKDAGKLFRVLSPLFHLPPMQIWPFLTPPLGVRRNLGEGRLGRGEDHPRQGALVDRRQLAPVKKRKPAARAVTEDLMWRTPWWAGGE